MKKWTFLLGTTMALAMLAGCSTNSDTASTAQAKNTANASATDSTTQGQDIAQQGTEQATADLIGKIKSIDGNSITLYKSTIDPSQMGKGRGGGGMSAPPQGQPGDGGASPADGGQVPPATPDGESAQVPANEGSQAPVTSGTSGTTDDSATNAASSKQGGMGGKDMFSDETVTITVSDSTVISAMTIENNEMKTTTKALSDLKADDVINVWLNADDSSLADQIQIGTGMGGGMRGGQMKGDTSSSTSSTTDTTSTDS